MSDTKLTAVTPDVPTSPGPPEPAAGQPRTEYVDHLYVDHGDRDVGPTANPPRCDMHVEHVADVPAAVAALLARDEASVLFPFLFLKPAVVDTFVAAVVRHRVAEWQVKDELWRKEHPGYRVAAMTPADHEKHMRSRIHPVGEMEGGWTVALLSTTWLGVTEDKGIEVPAATTAGGLRLVSEDEAQRALTPPVVAMLLEEKRQLVARVLDRVRKEVIATLASDEAFRESDVPSEPYISNLLAREDQESGTGEAAPVTEEPAPNPKLAQAVGTVVGKFYAKRGHGPNRAQIANRVSARKTSLTEALTWLCRPGGTITRRRLGRGNEYVPSDTA